jgi:hypothetical protein
MLINYIYSSLTFIFSTMNKYQTARLDSLKLIVKESKNNPDSLALLPKFGVVINRLETICMAIESHQVQQEKDLKGITADKDVALENLIDSTVEIAGAVYSYAHDMKNNTLMSKVNYKSTAVEKMTQSEVVAVASIILEEAVRIPAPEMTNEGISQEELTAYGELINHFKAIKSSKREAVISRTGTTENLNNLFKEASTLLYEKLDRLAIQFKRKDPDFYLRYKAARSIQTRAAQKRSTEGDPAQPA